MSTEPVFQLFKDIKTWKRNTEQARHKPLLILYAIAQYLRHEQKEFTFLEIDRELKQLLTRFSEDKYFNTHHPFWRLQHDSIWVIENSDRIRTSGGGNAYVSDLKKYNPKSGFTPDIYQAFAVDKNLPFNVINYFLKTGFSQSQQDELIKYLHIPNSPQKSCCPFCSLPSSRILFENALVLGLRDAFPVSPGHTLIIPRRHIASFFETTPDEQKALQDVLHATQQDLQQALKPDGFNIGINDGVAAGQTVMHLHIHLIPRYTDDCTDPRGGVRWIFPDKAVYWNNV
ncbi:HIT family protein [Candidatus Venteria ishoeyi]|uniref:AP-4-A phosphorylase n=1 Tax=Candidatus Venteria ishoeyi TaxID=1899563 RepID=A0A1H6F610_9GAMM|nr:HIT domain-containing protein [Candidatus Venteria ishoeyi]SEH04719.1 AP-4-A phosphorylase [Candidatus Venteria ishoeyi]